MPRRAAAAPHTRAGGEMPAAPPCACEMPRVCSFYGIVIWMYHDEVHHLGRPHFHVTYSDHVASIDIETRELLAGRLPSRARRLTLTWARAHRDELRANWERARRHEALQPIEPLR